MKECQIVEDLLPSYEEDLLQPDSKAFVDEHLKHCEKCRKLVADMGKPLPAFEVKRDVKKLQKTIKKSSFMQMLLIVLMAAGAAYSAYGAEEGLYFILIYPLLGALLYGFYGKMRIPLVIATITTTIFVALIPALEMPTMYDTLQEFIGLFIYVPILLLFFMIGFLLTKCWNMMTGREKYEKK